MKTRITLRTVVDHIQAVKNDLQLQIHSLEKRMDRGFTEVHEELEEAKRHRIALQEDLFETMRVQSTHTKKLARLSRA